MKAQVQHNVIGETEYPVLVFVCPGCEFMIEGTGIHRLPVNTDAVTPSWEWDENLENPTISPSILTQYEYGEGEKKTTKRCHSFLRNGIFEFLGDCTHSLKNQHVAMKDLPESFVKKETDG